MHDSKRYDSGKCHLYGVAKNENEIGSSTIIGQDQTLHAVRGKSNLGSKHVMAHKRRLKVAPLITVYRYL